MYVRVGGGGGARGWKAAFSLLIYYNYATLCSRSSRFVGLIVFVA